MKRKKIQIGDTNYILYEDKLRTYDGYVYGNDEVLDEKPEGTNIIGYIMDSGQKIAVCKKSYDKYGGIAVAACAVVAVAVITASVCAISKVTNVDVPHFSFNRDNVVEDLDDGVKKEAEGFQYSEYGTYDGHNASVFTKAKHGDATVQLVFGDVKSDVYKAGDTASIPLTIDIPVEDIGVGKLVYTRGDVVKEYPLVLEYTSTVKPDIPLGNDTSGINVPETRVDVQLEPSEVAPGETIPNDVNEYKESDVDFSNFDTLDDHPDMSKDKKTNSVEESQQ